MSVATPRIEASQSDQTVIHRITTYIVVFVFALSSGLGVLAICVMLLTGRYSPIHDFTSYWAAGNLLIHGADPYNWQAVSVLERAAVSRGPGVTVIMRNPPSALFLVVPLGWTSLQTGSILWSLLLLGCLGASLHMIWEMNGSPSSSLHLLGYLFAPSLTCLAMGQTGIFALLGLALFLYFHDTKSWLAGMGLCLCAIKPHLFLPFMVGLFAWIATRKAYCILVGAALSIGACCVVPLFWDRSVWSQYVRMAQTSGIKNEFMSDPATILRFAIDRNAMWLQFLPAAAACVWALWYFRRHHEDWDWRTHGSLLILVSLLAAPYSWFTDQAVLLPAVLYGLYSGRSLISLLALTSATLIEMLFFGVNPHSALCCWPVAAWLIWYLWPARLPCGDSVPSASRLRWFPR